MKYSTSTFNIFLSDAKITEKVLYNIVHICSYKKSKYSNQIKILFLTLII